MNTKVRLLWWKLKRHPFVSIGLVGVNLLIYLLCLVFPQIYDKGSCSIYHVLSCKEYGRILWAMFLHADAEHIFNNMIIVMFLGSMLESNVGHIKYGLVYFISGIAGNLFSLLVKWYNFDWAGSIGASGAVFGLDGLLLAMSLYAREQIDISAGRVIIVLSLSVYSGFTNQGIDNAAHVGGLFMGFLLGIPISIYLKKRDR